MSNLGLQACTAESWPPTAAATLRQHHAVLADPRIPGVASAVLKAAQAAGVLTVLDADICPVLALSTAASYISFLTFPPRTSQRYATALPSPHARATWCALYFRTWYLIRLSLGCQVMRGACDPVLGPTHVVRTRRCSCPWPRSRASPSSCSEG